MQANNIMDRTVPEAASIMQSGMRLNAIQSRQKWENTLEKRNFQ